LVWAQAEHVLPSDIRYIGHVRKTKPVLTKPEDRSTPMVLLGYKEGTKAYRLYDPHGVKVVVSCDVVFDEKAA